LRGAHGLIRKPLEPEDPGKRCARCHPLVKLEADRMRPVGMGNVSGEHALDMMPGVSLISQIMQ